MSSPAPSASDADVDRSTSEGPPLFYDITFSTYRVSTLHVGQEPLSDARLARLSQRLRDALSGGTLRGVELRTNQDDHFASRAGSLQAVALRWAPVGSILGLSEDADAVSDRRPPSRDLGSDAADEQREEDAAIEDLVAQGRRRRALHISCLLYTSPSPRDS